MSITALTRDNFKSEVLDADGRVLIDFWASWCGPCMMMSPIVDELADEISDLKVVKCNVDDEPELAGEFSISSIPTLVLIKDGKIENAFVGYRTKEALLKLLK